MNYAPELLLIGAVASVGVLHTIVPNHWVPINSARVKYVFSKSRALGNTMVNSWQLTEQIAFLIACRLRRWQDV
jgi:hypothetical protein